MKKLQFRGLLFVTAVLALGLMFAGCPVEGSGDDTYLSGVWEQSEQQVPVVGSIETYVPFSFQFGGHNFTAVKTTISNTNGVESSTSATGSYEILPGGTNTTGSVKFTCDGYTWTATYAITGGTLNLTTSGSVQRPNGVGNNSVIPTKINDVTSVSGLLKK